MTPSRRLQSNFKALDAAIRTIFFRKALNKGDPKTSYYNGDRNKKGVESDLVYIYKPCLAGEDFSAFSFVFDFLNKETEEFRIFAQFKPNSAKPRKDTCWGYHDRQEEANYRERQRIANNGMISTSPFTVDEFRIKLNKFNVKLNELHENGGLTESIIFDTLHEFFFKGNQFSVEDKVAEEQVKARNLIQKWEVTLNKEKKNSLTLMTEINKAKNKLATALANTEETREVTRLQAELEQAKANLKQKAGILNKRFEVAKNEQKLEILQSAHNNTLNLFNKALLAFKGKLSSVVRGRISLKSPFNKLK